MRDFARFFPHNDLSSAAREIQGTLRALYNLSLPHGVRPVPLQGTLPLNKQSAARAKDAGGRANVWGMLGKAAVFLFGVLLLGGLGLYVLQLIDYETAEKVMAPARAMLRQYLPPEWRAKLALGTEETPNETHIYAKLSRATRLSSSDALEQSGPRVAEGQEVRIVHSLNNLFFVRIDDQTVGWLPRDALIFRHLLPKGTLLYSRPDLRAGPVERLEQDRPVLLIAVRTIPAQDGAIVWSKVSFLDKKEIRYVQGKV
jgi:hypothetical protein